MNFFIEWNNWTVGVEFTQFPDWGTISLGPLQLWWRSAQYSVPGIIVETARPTPVMIDAAALHNRLLIAGALRKIVAARAPSHGSILIEAARLLEAEREAVV